MTEKQCPICGGNHFIKDASGKTKNCKCVDQVKRPAHYTKGDIECWDAVDVAVSNLQGGTALHIGSAIQYLWRWKEKNGVEDLKKAIVYINRAIENNS